MAFQAFEIAIEMIGCIREPLEQVRKHDADLARQLRRAASSVPLNLNEGRRRVGKDRRHHYRVAAGSADEVVAGLRVAQAWGYLGDGAAAEALARLDSVLAICWKLTH